MTTKTILVVDDSAVMRKLISSILAERAYQVLLTEDGEAALQQARSAAIDLVLTDWNMPAMGGGKLIRALREMSRYAETPVLVLTTEARESEKNEAREAGANGWLRKPVEPATLLEVVASLLE
ncbi:Chemotaxis regulator - transmits chemoreceptor signals to flagelllar motor components CheY [Collimonas arenae]|uniref:Chemotaxis regulator-transmits chemoreceptor signals to flagelllar motor components CheY n=1 Tax=Collimonas arenae TaxID=279058 RepID=A0A0A1F977_9BURK|nr:response regulator [Collimonas arenae]AIY40315.1 Chemotaxis regulator - transmits chemoreceptor signals to flagelllar motor components CheY [Collimonas arenae]